MSLIDRLLSRSYRRGLAAEARGDLEEAARDFATAGRASDAIRVRRVLAEQGDDEAALLHLRAALALTSEGESRCIHGREVERDLGGLLFRLGSSEPSFLEEAAERLRAAGEHLKAAEALLLLGRVAEAKDLLADGRHYERLEQIDDMEAASASRRSRAEKAMSMAGEAAALGRREEALELSSLAAEAGMDEGALLRERLTNARPRGSVSLRPAGACAALRCLTEGVVLLGRGDQSPLRLHDPGISRQHARLSWAKRESWLLEDLGSRNGTFVGDLPIAGSLPLEAAGGRFSLGPSCRIGWRRVGEGSLLCSVERGLSAGARLLLLNGGVSLADVFPAMPEGPRLLFGDGWFVIEAGGDAFLGERELPRASRMELLRGDVLEIGGARLEVLDSS